MFSHFLVALNAVLPMFVLLAIGFMVRESGMLKEAEIKRVNHMVFVVFFPALMFHNLYGAKLAEAINVKLILFGIIAVFVIFFLSIAVVLPIEKSPKTRGAMIQAIYRSNFVILGVPVVTSMYGDGNLGMTAVMVTVIVPLYNLLAVIILEIFRGGKPDPKHIAIGVLKNPLIMGAFAGIFTVLINLKLPVFLESVVGDMSSVATPMSLIVLGASIDFKSMRAMGRNIAICVVGRLIVVPAIGLTAAALLGFRGMAFVSLIAMFTSSTSVSSFTMAESMDSDGKLAGNCVIFSSAFACFTMFLWIFLFKSLGMF